MNELLNNYVWNNRDNMVAVREMFHHYDVEAKTRGGPRIFFGRGCTRVLLSFNTNKPHSFFLQNTSCIRGGGGGGGGRTPCTLPLDPPLKTLIDNRNLKTKVANKLYINCYNVLYHIFTFNFFRAALSLIS